MNCLSSFLQKGVPCHSLGGSSWISQQLLKVMLGLAQNVDRQKKVPASFSIFRFDNGVSMTCHSSTWTYRSSPRPPRGGTLKAWIISAFSAAWHQQAQSQLRFYKRLDPLCMWLAIWRTTYSQSGMAQALSLKSMMSHPLPASLSLAKAFGGKWTGSYQVANAKRVYSLLCVEYGVEFQETPPSETGKLCFEQKQFWVSLYKHEAASTWNRTSIEVLGGRTRRVLSASLFTSFEESGQLVPVSSNTLNF